MSDNLLKNEIIELNNRLKQFTDKFHTIEKDITALQKTENRLYEDIKLKRDKIVDTISQNQSKIYKKLTKTKLLSEERYDNDEILNQVEVLEEELLRYFENIPTLEKLIDYLNTKSIDYNRELSKYLNKSINIKFLDKQLDEVLKSSRILASGKRAEEDTARVISYYPDKPRILKNNRLGTKSIDNDKMIYAENDIIIINEKGIFLLEIKNSSKNLIFDEKGNLIRENSKNFKVDILQQCLNHENLVRMVLNESFEELSLSNIHVDIIPIIVTANNFIDVENKNIRIPVLRKNQIQDFIYNEYQSKNKLSSDEIDLIYNILYEKDVGPAKFKHKIDVDTIFYNISLFIAIDNNYEELIKVDSYHERELINNSSLIESNMKKLNELKIKIKDIQDSIKDKTKKMEDLIEEEISKAENVLQIKLLLKKDPLIRIAMLVCILCSIVILISPVMINKKHNKLVDANKILNDKYKESLEDPIAKNKELLATLEEVKTNNNMLKNVISDSTSNLANTVLLSDTRWIGEAKLKSNGKYKVYNISLESSNNNLVLNIGEGSYRLLNTYSNSSSGLTVLRSSDWITPVNELKSVDLNGIINGNTFNGILTEKDDINTIVGEFKLKKSN